MFSQLLLGSVLAASLPQMVMGASATFSVPFQKVNVAGQNILPNRRCSRHISAPEFDDQGFWFANWTVGAGKNLILLIDSGSTDVYLNPGVYQPSSDSKDLHKNFTITFETTNPDGSGTETIGGPLYDDIVSLDGTRLSLRAQTLGTVTEPVSPPSFPHDGLVGFAGLSQSAINQTSWFQHICDHGLVKECRFGLAYDTDNTGVQYFGYLEENRFKHSLSVAPVVPNQEWASWMDIALDGKVVEEDAWFVTDSGTTIIFGPIPSVQNLFDAAGIQSVLVKGSPSTLTGYFSCSNPPTVGFGLPSTGNATAAEASRSHLISHRSKVFNILPSQLISTRNGDNCTASIVGTDEFPFWLVGQVFFQGKYVDHDHDRQTMGFAYLGDD